MTSSHKVVECAPSMRTSVERAGITYSTQGVIYFQVVPQPQAKATPEVVSFEGKSIDEVRAYLTTIQTAPPQDKLAQIIGEIRQK